MTAELNAVIAKLSYMVNGKVGVDWRDGYRFVLAEKGDEYEAIQLAVDALQRCRAALQGNVGAGAVCPGPCA